MLDIKFIRENIDLVKKSTADKQYDPALVDQLLDVDKGRLDLLQKVEKLRSDRNKAAKEKNIKTGKRVKMELKELEPKLSDLDNKVLDLIHQIPNPADESVPVGKREEENVEVRKWGKIPEFDFEPKGHLELGTDLGIIDFERGAKVSGSQFYYLKGDAVMLEFALMQFGLEFLRESGYMPIITPDLAKSKYYWGTGYQPKGEEAQIYEIEGEDLGLIATSEVTMAGLHSDELLRKKDFPLRYAATSHCFRKEAGAYGKYSKGLYRVHQFTKLEMFVFCSPEESKKMHQEMLSIEEGITQALEIPYRVLEMCTGDLGAMASKKYDLEAWMAGRGDYGEITSTSNTTDYQSRNLNVKFDAGGKHEYAHMLNGTTLVSSRIPIVILENNQQKDGSVRIPKVLQKWMGKEIMEVPKGQ